eukprot:CAMPEP_0177580662 /NCGR_PEP_ID=MMETSP0419_2-20121207/1697_1 /TAXON_ID=582737 /ORGANISM="Tetraselmis sp., Strain GSL018" /LENGTH=325 /DNA_ID=CAMNT_0019069579 /DNA_START=586 /DNA_END=1560 /DNA_ORIENTATION=-
MGCACSTRAGSVAQPANQTSPPAPDGAAALVQKPGADALQPKGKGVEDPDDGSVRLPTPDPIFSNDRQSIESSIAPAKEFVGKADPIQQSLQKMKHSGKGSTREERQEAAAQATRNFFQQSTGIIPRCFAEAVIAIYDTNGDGMISTQELVSLAKDLQVLPETLWKALVKDEGVDRVSKDDLLRWFYNDHSFSQLKNMFERFDTNRDGYVDVKEVPHILRICAESISDENVEVAMKKMDTDGDNRVSFQEFCRWFNDDCKLVTFRSFFSLYAQHGKHGDFLDINNVKQMLLAMGADLDVTPAERVMDEIDSNKNGMVELDEFITW